MDANYCSIAEKVKAGERLSFDEGVSLFFCDDLLFLGRLADIVRRRRHGEIAYYVLNRHINYSNLCVDSCLFCSFARKPGQEGGYTYSLEEIWEKAKDMDRIGGSELHIVGGLHPTLPFSYYIDMLRGLKERYPAVTPKAFTASEITHFAEQTGKTVREVLVELKEAGLGELPGGGAEIFAERARKKLVREKGTAEDWLEVHRTAHEIGLRSNCTMLYGHIERVEERVDHMNRLRDLQDETGGFLAFIPLKFHRENNRLGKLQEPTAVDVLKHIAIARLYLDNIDHIKAYWPMIGVRSAQIALSMGADDIDGTIVEEKIYHMAGAKTPQELAESDIRALIEEAGFRPVKRDALYNSLDPVQA